MNSRVLHDTAHSTALKLLEIVKPCIREEEWRDAYAEFYAAVREGLVAYEEQAHRNAARLGPLAGGPHQTPRG